MIHAFQFHLNNLTWSRMSLRQSRTIASREDSQNHLHLKFIKITYHLLMQEEYSIIESLLTESQSLITLTYSTTEYVGTEQGQQLSNNQ